MGYSVAISTFAGGILSPSPKSLTVGRFRFIVCSDLIDRQLLSVVEYPALPPSSIPYAAVSYPWSGLKTAGPSNASSFFRLPLEGGQPSDPLSFAVLRTACLAARHFGADLLWIDQICIIQTDANDKNWQISRMFGLYNGCKACLVLPGGLQRLAGHNESTNWIERSWTLQEAMPKATYAIFGWVLGGGRLGGLTNGHVDEIEKGQSAMMELGQLLQAAFVGFTDWGVSRQKVPFGIFGTNPDPILALMGVKEATVPEMRDMAVWRSALLRTCSQPRDSILSIMGIFGVELDVAKYARDDRERAAVDLAFEILRSGRGASWLGAAPGCSNMSIMCAMPSFPDVDGQEVYYRVDGQKRKPWDVMGTGLTWYIKPSAKAIMEKRGSGRLRLTTKTLRIKLGAPESHGSSIWKGFRYSAAMILDEGPEKGSGMGTIHLSAPLPGGGYQALVVGSVEHYCLPATAAMAQLGAALFMILRWNPSMKAWENLTYGTIGDVESVTRSWPTCIHDIGY